MNSLLIQEPDSFEKLGLPIGLVINCAIAYNQCPTGPGHYGPDIEVKIIDLLDDPKHGEPHEHATDALPFFSESNAAIAKTISEGKGVLIHCYGSISRSAVLLIAYLMESQNLSAEEATAVLKSKWDATWPNDTFVRNLIDYEVLRTGKEYK